MNRDKRNSRFRFLSEMNITSLADVAINLMIIFLIAGISVSLSRAGIPIQVPKSTVALPQRTHGVSVSLDKQGQIFVDEKQVNLSQFSNELTSALSRKASSQVYLLADENINYGLVIEIISKIRETGIENIGLVANPEVLKKLRSSGSR